jgi:hypothetical protein
MVGSCATRSREPGQGRKAAAVSGVPGAPRECPAGAGCRRSVGRSWVQGGVRGPLSILGVSVAPDATRCSHDIAWLLPGARSSRALVASLERRVRTGPIIATERVPRISFGLRIPRARISQEGPDLPTDGPPPISFGLKVTSSEVSSLFPAGWDAGGGN